MEVNKSSKVGLFIPCYIDQLYPRVAIATLELLEKLGCEVSYPIQQTCCGQPFANAGYREKTNQIRDNFQEIFTPFDFIVCPSGSCTHYVKSSFEAHEDSALHDKTFELVEFIHRFLNTDLISAKFPYKVGYHSSCHGLRGLGLASTNELQIPKFNKSLDLLKKVEGIEIMDLTFPDECCGFGGSFSVTEEAVSVSMGRDRLSDHLQNGVEVITGNDMSCLMHLEGIIRRENKPVTIFHIAEILNGNKYEPR